jgi:hypothetical protein
MNKECNIKKITEDELIIMVCDLIDEMWKTEEIKDTFNGNQLSMLSDLLRDIVPISKVI